MESKFHAMFLIPIHYCVIQAARSIYVLDTMHHRITASFLYKNYGQASASYEGSFSAEPEKQLQ